jgi:hypothetical protein
MLTVAQQVIKFQVSCMYGTQRFSSSTAFTSSATESSSHPEALFNVHSNVILPSIHRCCAWCPPFPLSF